MAEGLAPGWYTNDEGERRYWTGESWVTPEADAPTEGTDEGTSESAPPPVEDAQPTSPKPRSKKPVIVTTIAVVAVVLAVAGAWWFTSRPTVDDLAIEACETKILGILKSPSTAVLGESEIRSYSKHAMDIWFEADALGRTTKNFEEALDGSVEGAVEVEARDATNNTATRIVVGAVDAENGFGANERSDWRCITMVQLDTMEVPSASSILEFGDEMTLLEGRPSETE